MCGSLSSIPAHSKQRLQLLATSSCHFAYLCVSFQQIGCTNAIALARFHEPCNFLRNKVARFLMSSKDAVLRHNKEAGNSLPEATKCKVAEQSHNFGRHRSNTGRNCNVGAYSKKPWTWAKRHLWLYRYNMPCEKVTTFLKSHLYKQKTSL